MKPARSNGNSRALFEPDRSIACGCIIQCLIWVKVTSEPGALTPPGLDYFHSLPLTRLSLAARSATAFSPVARPLSTS